ncbi:MAG: MarR family transcriptional regulator [Epulopiscium sp.]|nr:MarR family transcriptional regulator [Candidatus Epulonipiscium sp.]
MGKEKNTYILAMLIREVYSLSMYSMDEDISSYGITPQQMIVIKLIAHHGGMQNSELCKEMNLSKGTVSGIIKRLEKKGLVKRKEMEQDRRNEKIVFTEKGLEFANLIRYEMQKTFDNIFKNSSQDDIQRYIQVLREMIEKIKGGA